MTTSKQMLNSIIEAKRKACEAILLRELNYIGEQCVNTARDKFKSGKQYKDRTGNLTSSMGYVIVKNGRMWDENGEFNVEAAKAFLEQEWDITDAQRKQIENAVELKEKYDEAIEVIDEVAESYFGEVSSNWAESIWDSYIKYGESAISYVVFYASHSRKIRKCICRRQIGRLTQIFHQG